MLRGEVLRRGRYLRPLLALLVTLAGGCVITGGPVATVDGDEDDGTGDGDGSGTDGVSETFRCDELPEELRADIANCDGNPDGEVIVVAPPPGLRDKTYGEFSCDPLILEYHQESPPDQRTFVIFLCELSGYENVACYVAFGILGAADTTVVLGPEEPVHTALDDICEGVTNSDFSQLNRPGLCRSCIAYGVQENARRVVVDGENQCSLGQAIANALSTIWFHIDFLEMRDPDHPDSLRNEELLAFLEAFDGGPLVACPIDRYALVQQGYDPGQLGRTAEIDDLLYAGECAEACSLSDEGPRSCFSAEDKGTACEDISMVWVDDTIGPKGRNFITIDYDPDLYDADNPPPGWEGEVPYEGFEEVIPTYCQEVPFEEGTDYHTLSLCCPTGDADEQKLFGELGVCGYRGALIGVEP